MRGSCPLIGKMESGFTLVELIIVMAVFGILTAIAIPTFVSMMPKYRLNGSARQVMGDLMAARMKAVKENTTVKVEWISDHEYKVSTDSEEKTIDIQTNYRDITINSFKNINFKSTGTANTGSITITNSTSSKKVTVAITGRVKIN